MADANELEITHEMNAERGGRYVIRFPDGAEAELRYSLRDDGVISLDHTETPKHHRGGGIAGRLVERAAKDARDLKAKLVAPCPFAKAWLDKHPEYAGVRAG